MKFHNAQSRSLKLKHIAIGTVLAMSSAQPVWAGSCSLGALLPGFSAYYCTGSADAATDQPVSIIDNGATVYLGDGFGLDVRDSGQQGINLVHVGHLISSTAFPPEIYGGRGGIMMRRLNGSIQFEFAGTVSGNVSAGAGDEIGETNSGIFIDTRRFNVLQTVDIRDSDVTGLVNGIRMGGTMIHEATAGNQTASITNTTVRAVDTDVAQAGAGIFMNWQGLEQRLDYSGTIESDGRGLFMNHSGVSVGGDTILNYRGDIVADDEAIYVQTSEAQQDTNLSVNGSITSNLNTGILVEDAGTGVTKLTLDGTLQSLDTGVSVSSTNAAAGDVTVDLNGDVHSSAGSGAVITNQGSGTSSVTVKGKVTSSSATDGQPIVEVNHLVTNGATGQVDIYGQVAPEADATGNLVGLQLSGSDTAVLNARVHAGAIVSGSQNAIQATGGHVNIVVDAGASVNGNIIAGVDTAVTNTGSGATNVIVNDKVTSSSATDGHAIVEVNHQVTNDAAAQVDIYGELGQAADATGNLVGLKLSSSDTSVARAHLYSGASVSGSQAAIETASGNVEILVDDGAGVNGNIVATGDGTTLLKIVGDGNNIPLMDGGDDVTVVDGYVDELVFQDSNNYSLSSATTPNWEVIRLDNTQASLSDGTLDSGQYNGGGVFLTNGSELSSADSLVMNANLDIDATSTFSHAQGGTITGNVTNSGMLYWQNLGKTLTINGDYVGNGGTVSLETVLDGDDSLTDRLYVTGNTSGMTTLDVRPAGGSGAQTVNGIQLVQVDGDSAAGSFSLAGPLQAGAYEYVLKQGNDQDANDWFLNSFYKEPVPEPTPEPTTAPEKTYDLYRPGVVNYFLAQQANVGQGFIQLATLHQRMGEQWRLNDEGGQSWLRPYYLWQDNVGHSRYAYEQSGYGFQLGQELDRRVQDGSDQRFGLTLDYYRGRADFKDRIRPLAGLEKKTGRTDTESIGMGGYFTRMKEDGSYVDLVGQVSRLSNDHRDAYGDSATQDATRVALSAEASRLLEETNGFRVEAQGQLSYQHIQYDSFSDATSPIEDNEVDVLRGRIGLRTSKNVEKADGRTDQYYLVANVIRHFNGDNAMKLDDAVIKEHFDENRFELGGGLQKQVSKSGYVYADVRANRGFEGGTNSFEGNVGLKIKF